MNSICPLCTSDNISFLYKTGKRTNFSNYFLCKNCNMVFMDRDSLPFGDDEKKRYLTHNNNLEDEGYKNFLQKFIDTFSQHISKGDFGLDFGSGPEPALAYLLSQQGFHVKTYDPFFSPDSNALKNKYDFITCIEAAEHFHNPRKEFDIFQETLKSCGILAIMTQVLNDWEKFPDWWYHRDFTHVSFYSKTTMQWIANKYNWKLSFPAQNIFIFRK